MDAHIEDAEKYLGMPVVFSEFGVSSKDPGYNSTYRDTLISTVYSSILNSTKKGGSGASYRLALFNSLCSFKCNWSYKKKKNV